MKTKCLIEDCENCIETPDQAKPVRYICKDHGPWERRWELRFNLTNVRIVDARLAKMEAAEKAALEFRKQASLERMCEIFAPAEKGWIN